MALRLIRLGFAGAGKEEVALASVLGERGGAGEFIAGFREAAEFGEEVATDCREQMVVFQGRLVEESVEEFKPRGRATRHGNSDGAI